MATPAPAIPKPRPYTRFLTSALHTRFVHAALVSLLLSWDNAILTGVSRSMLPIQRRLYLTKSSRLTLGVVSVGTRWSEGCALLHNEPVHLHPSDSHLERWSTYLDLPSVPTAILGLQLDHLLDLLLVSVLGVVVLGNIHLVFQQFELGHKRRCHEARHLE